MARTQRETMIVTLDTETYGLGGAIKRIAIYDGMKVHYGYDFEDVEPVLEMYNRMGFNVHVYCHNLEFDARKMPRVLCKENTNWNNTLQINGRYAKIACKAYTFHDSWRLLPSSLANLCEDFEVEHGKLDLWEEVEKRTPGKYRDKEDYFMTVDKDDPLYLEYLGYDVISLYEVLEKLLDLSGLTPTELVGRVSTASLSKYLMKNGHKGNKFLDEEGVSDYEKLSTMKAWNSRKPLKNCLGEKEISYIEVENVIREGYYGGRTEVFIPWAEPEPVRERIVRYRHYDVVSLYPSVMIDNDFPIGWPEYISLPGLVHTKWEEWLNYHEGLGYITAHVYIPEQTIPPLPVHMGKLVFPTGHIEGTWTYTELEYAIKECGVVVEEIKELVHFKKTAKVFHNFVTTFHKLKEYASKEGKTALKTFAKLILNTAYGWSVLNRDDKTELKNIDLKGRYDIERILFEDEELGMFQMKSYVDSESIQPQIGAYVSSYARIVLLKGLRLMATMGRVFYCDTDSIVSEGEMPESMVDKWTLGKWDLEGKLYEGIFLQPKVYYEDKEHKDEKKQKTIRFKGVSRDTQKTFNYQFYKSILEKLQEESKDVLIVERDKELLHSIMASQKQKKDSNILDYRDKKMYLARLQKRNMNYRANTSKAWHMDDLEMFRSFTFKQPVIPYETRGNMIDMAQTRRRKI